MPPLLIDHTLQERVTELCLSGDEPVRLKFKGNVAGTAKTEIFLEGKSNVRFQPPPNSVGYIRKVAIGYNLTDTTVATDTPEVSTATFSRLGATMTVTEAATHVRVDVEANDTLDDVRVFVTGGDATDMIYWEVSLEVWNMSIPEGTMSQGIYDGIPKG